MSRRKLKGSTTVFLRFMNFQVANDFPLVADLNPKQGVTTMPTKDELLRLEIERAMREIDYITARTNRFLEEADELSEEERLFINKLQKVCQDAKIQAEFWTQQPQPNNSTN